MATNMDLEFFKDINTEEKAYILGFIFADGNIDRDSRGTPNRIRITLKSEDLDILVKIKNAVKYSGAIHFRESFEHNRMYNRAYLYFGNRQVASDLAILGCEPNKTHTKKFPIIPKGLERHFLRGYFDGNGSIYHLNNLTRCSDVRIGLASGSKHFMDSVVNTLVTNLDVNPKGLRIRERDVQLTKSGAQAFRILDFLYKDAKIYLDRKFIKYIQYTELLERGELKCRQ